jgi:hypothetical protein
MKILNVLGNTEISATEKLTAVNALVSTIREKYGNTELTIQPEKVPTTEGMVSINLLNDEEKVAIVTHEIRHIVMDATAETEQTEGVIFDRMFESLVAINPVLTNLNQSSDSVY